MPRYYFAIRECTECGNEKLQPCFVFTADCGGDEIALCQEHLAEATVAFKKQDFDVGSDPYENAVAGIERQKESRIRRGMEAAEKWAELEKSKLWSTTETAEQYHAMHVRLNDILYVSLPPLAVRVPGTYKNDEPLVVNVAIHERLKDD